MKMLRVKNTEKEKLKARLLRKGYIIAEVDSEEEIKKKKHFLTKANVVLLK